MSGAIDLELDNALELDVLASRANEEHRLAESSAKSALDHARAAGEHLTTAKAGCKHGEWIPWLETNFEGTRFTAARYMRLSEKWSELNVRSGTHLGIRQALELLSEPREVEEPEVEFEIKPSPEVLLRRIAAFKDARLTSLFEAHELTTENAALLGHIKQRGMTETFAALLENESDTAKVRQSKPQLEHLLKQNESGQTDEQTLMLVQAVEGGEAESVFDAHRIRQAERQAERDAEVRAVAQKAAQDLAGHDKQLDPKAVAEVERIALDLASGEGWEDLSEEEQVGFIQGAAGEEQAATYQGRQKPKAEKDPEDMVSVKRGLLLSLKQLARYAPISQRQTHMTEWNDKL